MCALIEPYLGCWCNVKLVLVGDYSDENSKIIKIKFIGDEAAVAYLCMECINAVAYHVSCKLSHDGTAVKKLVQLLRVKNII